MRGRTASFCGLACVILWLAMAGPLVEGAKPKAAKGDRKAATKQKKTATAPVAAQRGANWMQAGGNQAAMAGWPGAAAGMAGGAGRGGGIAGDAGGAAVAAGNGNLPVANPGTAAPAVTSATADAAAQSQTPTLGPGDATGLNAKVLQFAESHLGQRVGNGQCYELGVAALAAAGAQPPQGNSYGQAVPLADAKPGDIIVFNQAYFRGSNYWMLLGDPIHVAILEAVSGSQIVVLHQNFNGQLFVTRSTLNLGDLKRGSVTIYQPVR